MRGGLTRRTIAVSGVLALLIGAVFAVLVRAIAEQRDSASLATRSEEVIARASALERLVLDLETGQRGFLVTRDADFLEPWRQARASYQAASRALVTVAAGVDTDVAAAERIVALVDAYVREYSVPLVEAARRGERAAGGIGALDEGKRRVDEIRALFGAFVRTQRRAFAVRDDKAQSDARRAIVIATAGLAGSIALIVLFGAYLTRAIALPVRRAAVMAGRLAGGDLSTRMPETSVGEVRELERAFNTMGDALEASLKELTASRARVVATADETRRRIERDLHDGAQQRLVHAVITLKLARRALAGADGPAAELVDEALEHAETANAELRDLAHGILPAALTRGGLGAAVETLAGRLRLPVSVNVTDERLPPALEAAGYFIVAEALTNTIKHARASRAEVTASVTGGDLVLEVRDDGVGGADADGGSSGLLGLHDRAAAMNGELEIVSPPGGGTLIRARLPIPDTAPAGT